MFDHCAKDCANSDDGGDETEAAPHAAFDSFADIGHRHRPGSQAHKDAGKEEGDEGLDSKLKNKDQNQDDCRDKGGD